MLVELSYFINSHSLVERETHVSTYRYIEELCNSGTAWNSGMIALMIVITNAVRKFLLIHVPWIHSVTYLFIFFTCLIALRDLTLPFCRDKLPGGKVKKEEEESKSIRHWWKTKNLIAIKVQMNGAISQSCLELWTYLEISCFHYKLPL